jgi:hypothetical protein
MNTDGISPAGRATTRTAKFGVRWQSEAAIPLFDRGSSFQSGVALRFAPQSKICGCAVPVTLFFIRVYSCSFVVESFRK